MPVAPRALRARVMHERVRVHVLTIERRDAEGHDAPGPRLPREHAEVERHTVAPVAALRGWEDWLRMLPFARLAIFDHQRDISPNSSFSQC